MELNLNNLFFSLDLFIYLSHINNSENDCLLVFLPLHWILFVFFHAQYRAFVFYYKQFFCGLLVILSFIFCNIVYGTWEFNTSVLSRDL